MNNSKHFITVDTPSTKPYFIRALHEWCTDNGFTPYMLATVDSLVRVPQEFVRDGQIVLNISYDATGNLKITNEMVNFQARFGGVARDISVPIDNVAALYARENGIGMSFETTSHQIGKQGISEKEPRPDPPSDRPNFKVVK